MADAEPLSIRGIHWRDALPFTHLFRAFRVAIHPSKLGLALAALLLLYVGGHVLDYVWPVAYRAVPDEVLLYEQFSGHHQPGETFADIRRTRRGDVEHAYAALLLATHLDATPDAAAADARSAKRLGEVKAKIVDARRAEVDAAGKAHDAALAKAGTDGPARAAADAAYRDRLRDAYDTASATYRSAARIRNDGLFDAFFEYESVQLSNAVQGVREWNWFGSSVDGTTRTAEGLALPVVPSTGIIPSVERFFAVGPMWLLTQHWVYFILFGTGFLVLWSVFGGAICRIAAVHVARDEKLSIRAALVFSVEKFLSFMCAPLIPLGLLAAIGLVTAVASLVGAIPGVGPVVMGLAFILALIAGLAMAGLLVGLVGGFNLMYPTVAVEGSDSFDAISRSFSYLYARPWRLAVYTVVSLVYGSACYLFVRLFIYLVLSLTHTFVGLGVFTHADSGAPLLSALWPSPSTAGRLTYSVDGLGLSFPQEVGAGLIWFWVHLFIALLGAFVVSFYFSSNTIIYYLLRREVDATDLDDVYVDPSDEDDAAEPDPADPPPPRPEFSKAAPTKGTPSDGPPVTIPTGDPTDPAPPT